MPTTQPPLRLKLKLRWKHFTISELYWLKETTYAAAKPTASLIAQYRRYLLGKDTCIVSAAMSFANTLRERKSVVTQPLDAHPKLKDAFTGLPNLDWTPNDPEVGFGYMRETPSGKWVPWLIRFLPDTWIRDNQQIAPQITVHPAAVPSFIQGNFDNDAVITGAAKFLRIIQDSTQYVSETVANGAGERQWNTENWDALPFVEVRSHDVGNR